jgi:hypothetical protein
MSTKQFYHDIDLVKVGQLINARIQNITTVDRGTLGGTLDGSHAGLQVWDTDLDAPFVWNGSAWLRDALEVSGDVVYKGVIKPTNSDTGAIEAISGYQYVVDTAGTLAKAGVTFSPSAVVEVGDLVLFTSASAASIIQRNAVSATDTVEGLIELATQTEVNTGTDTTRAITPATFAGATIFANIDSDLTANAAAISANAGAISTNAGNISTNSTNIGTIGNLTTSATNLVGAINEHETQINNNDSDILALNTFTGLGTTLTTAATDLAAAINEHESLINTNISNIGTIGNLTTTATNLVDAVNELDSDFSASISALDTFTGVGTALTTTATDLAAAINEHEGQINNLDSDVSSLLASSNTPLVLQDPTNSPYYYIYVGNPTNIVPIADPLSASAVTYDQQFTTLAAAADFVNAANANVYSDAVSYNDNKKLHYVIMLEDNVDLAADADVVVFKNIDNQIEFLQQNNLAVTDKSDDVYSSYASEVRFDNCQLVHFGPDIEWRGALTFDKSNAIAYDNIDENGVDGPYFWNDIDANEGSVLSLRDGYHDNSVPGNTKSIQAYDGSTIRIGAHTGTGSLNVYAYRNSFVSFEDGQYDIISATDNSIIYSRGDLTPYDLFSQIRASSGSYVQLTGAVDFSTVSGNAPLRLDGSSTIELEDWTGTGGTDAIDDAGVEFSVTDHTITYGPLGGKVINSTVVANTVSFLMPLTASIPVLNATFGSMVDSSGAYQTFSGTNYIDGNGSLTGDLTDLDAAIAANASSISTNAGNIANLDSDLTALDGRVTSLETNPALKTYFAGNVSLGAGSATTITHNLALTDKDSFTIRVADTNSSEVSVDVDAVGVNSLTLTSLVALSGVKVTIIGF